MNHTSSYSTSVVPDWSGLRSLWFTLWKWLNSCKVVVNHTSSYSTSVVACLAQKGALNPNDVLSDLLVLTIILGHYVDKAVGPE